MMVAFFFRPCTAPVSEEKSNGVACAEVATMQIRMSAFVAAARGVGAVVARGEGGEVEVRKRERAGGEMS